MSGSVCGPAGPRHRCSVPGGGERLADALDVPLLAQIPLDMCLREAGDCGVPVVVARPDSPSARAYMDLAHSLRPARRPLLGRSLPLTPV